MKIKRSFDTRRMVCLLYFLALFGYLIYGLTPTRAADYGATSILNIPAIDLTTEVVELKLINDELKTPEFMVGSFERAENKTMLIGHARTIFKHIEYLQIGDQVIYDDIVYKVSAKKILPKEQVKMRELLAPSATRTLVLMTCAGEDLGKDDATHRLILEAKV